MAELLLRGVTVEPGSVQEMLVMQLIDRDRVQRVLEVQLLASAAFQSKDTSKVHERLLAHAFPEVGIRKAIRDAHVRRVADSIGGTEIAFGVDAQGNLSLSQTKDGPG